MANCVETMTDGRLAVVCDDDPMIRMIVSVYLRDEGFEVVAVGSGTELAEALSSGGPEVLVLDNELPDANGEELVGGIMAASPHCRIILFSGRATGGEPPEGVFARVSKQGTHELAAAIHRAAAS